MHFSVLRRLLLVATALVLASFATDTPEDELKSAVVLSFLRYGEWRPAPQANAPLLVGVVGRDSFAETLRRNLEGKQVGDHSIHIVALKNPNEPHVCHILYFAEDRSVDTKAVLQGAALAHALTIGESKDFLAQGGAVNLFLLDGHIAFEVNLEALDRAGISISSRLLRFGQIRNARKGERS